MRRCLAVLLVLFALPAMAQSWVEVGSDPEVVHYVDAGALVREGDIVRVTKRAVYRDPQPIGDTPGLPLIAESVGIVEDDCRLEQHRVLSIRLLGIDGAELWSSGDMRRVWESIERDSPGMATLLFACQNSHRK